VFGFTLLPVYQRLIWRKSERLQPAQRQKEEFLLPFHSFFAILLPQTGMDPATNEHW
jgi:hypothetical protein